MLELNKVQKKYGKNTVLNSIDLKVLPGEIIGLVGENGAGKSTLLNIIATLNKPTSGLLKYKELNYQKDIKKIRKRS